jgi:plasmid stabilization system protein ParE
MARVIWTEPAVADLDAIADYIAIDNRPAAVALVQNVLAHIEQLAVFPESGSKPPELGRATRYRQIIEPPCRVVYRFDGSAVYILHVMRSQQRLRSGLLAKRIQGTAGSARKPHK